MTTETDLAVSVSGLTVRFGDFTAVDNVSFGVKKGEIFGFLGANGAGKTTTIRVLCGLLEPAEGRVEVAGVSIERGLQLVKAKVGYMSQKFTLYNDLTVDENLAFAATLRNIPALAFKARKRDLFDWIGFTAGQDSLVADLPGGVKQQISLVASILHEPDVVFLDEPTAGVTPIARARFWKLIRELSEQGKTVFVTTHYMDEAEQCHRVALMRTGRIVALGSPAELKQKTFPEALYEMEFSAEVNEGKVEEMLRLIRSREEVRELQPYGLRYHVAVTNSREWEAFVASKAVRDTFNAKRIVPSLEDVFIRVVEGDAR